MVVKSVTLGSLVDWRKFPHSTFMNMIRFDPKRMSLELPLQEK